MGLGKTFVGSEKMRELNSHINLLICQKSKVQDWKEHFEKYYHSFPAHDLTAWKPEYFRDEERLVTSLLAGRRVYIINYELAWRRKELLGLKDFTLILDESSLIQNPTAKQTKFVLKLGERAQNVILLSGTPTSGKYENLWTQAHLLGWDIPRRLYEEQYVNWDKLHFGGQIVRVPNKKEPYKNVERLKRKFRENGAVFMKTEECFELPEQTFIEVKVSKPKQYAKFQKDCIATVEGKELVGDTSLTKLLHSRQLCGVYSPEKLQAYEDILKATNDRLIVFYNFAEECERLIEITKKLERPFSVVNGAGKNLRAYEEYEDSVTFIQYQAGAMGLNLQKANKIIYYTLPLRSELFEQSKKRIHRIGQEKPCFYYVMMCGGTVERKIYETLNLRKDFTDNLFR
jgi:SNF2 family DNA or RNA helicase